MIWSISVTSASVTGPVVAAAVVGEDAGAVEAVVSAAFEFEFESLLQPAVKPASASVQHTVTQILFT